MKVDKKGYETRCINVIKTCKVINKPKDTVHLFLYWDKNINYKQ